MKVIKIATRFLIPVFISFMASFCTEDFSRSELEVRWIESSETAFRIAKDNKRPVLVNIYSKDCQPCLKMKKEFFPLKKFHAYMEKYNIIPVLIDTEKNPEEMEKFVREYGIDGMPTILLIDSDKNEIGRSEGYRSASLTFGILERTMDEWKKPENL